MFILMGNLLGMILIPTFTSQIVVTFAIAITIFWGNCYRNCFARLSLFLVIPGMPIVLAPLLIPIEVISYFVRPVSLSVRLFANMMVGTHYDEVFAGFTAALGTGIANLTLGALTGLNHGCCVAGVCFYGINVFVFK